MKFPFGEEHSAELSTTANPFEGVTDVAVLVLTGPDAGTSFPLPPEGGVAGSGPQSQFQLTDPTVAPCHVRFRRLASGRYRVENLAGEDAVKVEEEVAADRELFDGERVRLSEDTLLRIRYRDLAEVDSLDTLHEATIRDALTGIANRPYFIRRLDQELGFARRHSTSLSLLMIDIDDFHNVNDEHGQLAGDEVIYSMAHALSDVVRIEDLVARYGGDEFVVFSRGYDAPDAEQFGARLCQSMRDQSVSAAGKSFKMTLSVGVAGFPSSAPKTSMDLIARADAALHLAKTNGGDRVAVWQAG